MTDGEAKVHFQVNGAPALVGEAGAFFCLEIDQAPSCLENGQAPFCLENGQAPMTNQTPMTQ